MKEKTIAFCLLAGIIILLALSSVTQWFLFNSKNNNFVATMESAMSYVETEDWENAQLEAQKANTIWNNGNFIVALKYAETDFTFLNVYLTRFQLAIKQKDAKEAVKEGYSSLYIFKNITSVSPKP